MKKCIFLAVAGFLCSLSTLSYAGDSDSCITGSSPVTEGVTIQFTIDSKTINNEKSENSSYTNGVLVGLNDFTECKFFNLYKLKFITKSTDGKNLHLVFTLNQYFGEKLYYIGDKAIDVPIGETNQFELSSKKSHYKIIISTAYGNSDLVAK